MDQPKPQALSRYKSVRSAARNTTNHEPSSVKQIQPAADDIPQNAGLQRSKSRYKRGRATTAGASDVPVPAVPAVSALPPNVNAISNHVPEGIPVQKQRGHHDLQEHQGEAHDGRQEQGDNIQRYKSTRARPRDTSRPSAVQSQQHEMPARAHVRTNSGPRHSTMPVPVPQAQVASPPHSSRRNTLTSRQRGHSLSQAHAQALSGVPQYPAAVPSMPAWAVQEIVAQDIIAAEKVRMQKLRAQTRAYEEKLRSDDEAREAAARAEQERIEEDARRAEEEKRMIREKQEQARCEHEEAKKRDKASRGLFSRAGSDGKTSGLRQKQSNKVLPAANGSSGKYDRREVPALDSDAARSVQRISEDVVARPYQSPPKSHIKKESISGPISSSAPRPSADQNQYLFQDAPKSAVNAGERSVIVSCNESNAIISVDTNTTVDDIIRAATTEMPREKIDPKTAVLLECFHQQGLERRMRRYEHVRDTLNSWQDDRASNKLNVVPPVPNDDDVDLTLNGAPKRAPQESQSFPLSHSPKPGSWDKRVVTLRPDGTVLVAKERSESDRDRVCHLSDFDVYIPTRAQAKRLKPGAKKMVFAIKSQQKPSFFQTGQNFVHYFATKDHAVAANFQVAMQSWRSWYLTDKMGLGQPKEENTAAGGGGFLGGTLAGLGGGMLGTTSLGTVEDKPFLDSGEMFNKASAKVSDEIAAKDDWFADLGYDLRKVVSGGGGHSGGGGGGGTAGAATAGGGLINQVAENEFSAGSGSNGPSTNPGVGGGFARSGTQKRTAGGLSGFGGRSGLVDQIPAEQGEDTFLSTGLLGRTYSKRQQAMQEGKSQPGARPSADQNRDVNWGAPLVDLTGNRQSQGGGSGGQAQGARKVSLKEEGFLINRF